MEQFGNFIAGEWRQAKSGQVFEDRNPARWDEVIGLFPSSGAEDVAEAVAAARAALPAWRRTPAPRRGELALRAAELLIQRKEELARLMTREMGKVLAETRGDVQEAIDTALYAVGEGRRLFAPSVPSELPDKVCLTLRQPVGVCGLITPWNFPIAVPSWKLFPALLAGNTVVFKPASDTPASAAKLVEILAEAGVPPGVVNLVFGAGPQAGEALLAHPEVALISFTGSSEVGRHIGQVCGQALKRCSLELGGKNAQIVMEDADLNLAVDGALWGAFGTTGQRCTATSRLIVHQAVYQEFLDRFLERTRRLRLGAGLRPETDMGPLINERQREKVDRYVKIGLQEGARLLLGGHIYQEGDCARGWFYVPTIFTEVTPQMTIAKEEIFGPVVAIMKVASLEEAIEVHNATGYGLSSSIYTREVSRVFRAVPEIEAGITYVNSPTIGAEAHLPFGGVKNSGNGHREGGWTAYDIFTEWKTVYVDYSGRLQKATIDVKEPG